MVAIEDLCVRRWHRAQLNVQDRPAHTFVLPVPLSRMVAPYATVQEPRREIGTAIFIPVTNAIEALNSKLRRAVRTRGHFPSDDAAAKLLYLVLNHAAADWKRPPREWFEAKTQFAVMFKERFVLA